MIMLLHIFSTILIQDCIVFTVTPLDPVKAPFSELRELIPVRLSTDHWVPNGSGIGVGHEHLWDSPTPPNDNQDTDSSH